ncbi:polyprenyl diphosphate synthase [Streptomyces sp. NPDC020379]|uniref:polyprenyl diphosphate synthase n=1 Tax=Streptomyces sp. NPDC020379 TaxID=3365071 RepID=UPI003788D878
MNHSTPHPAPPPDTGPTESTSPARVRDSRGQPPPLLAQSAPERPPAPAVQQDDPVPSSAAVPRHLAVILDGNRRWAHKHHLPVTVAYQAGAQRVHDLVTWCEGAHIRYVTVWALSQDNLHRDPAAVTDILHAITTGLRAMAATRRWYIRAIGALDLLPAEHAEALRALEEDTRGIAGVTLNAAVAYSGRGDIVDAVHTLTQQRGADGEHDQPVTEHLVARHLSTAGQPDIDLVIRTSGEQRLSGFMPWQTAEAELYFTDADWPGFTHDDFLRALHSYAGRDRRHGL